MAVLRDRPVYGYYWARWKGLVAAQEYGFYIRIYGYEAPGPQTSLNMDAAITTDQPLGPQVIYISGVGQGLLSLTVNPDSKSGSISFDYRPPSALGGPVVGHVEGTWSCA